ncbi:glycoside hydrolase [Tsuneonella sp. HG222]
MRSAAFLPLAALLAACATVPAAPPEGLRLDPFYTKYLDVGGIPLVSSARVPDAALVRAKGLIDGMLAHRPDLRATLAREGYRVAVLAESEGVLDLPEQAHWTKPGEDDPRLTRCERKHYAERIGSLTDRQYWDARARGMAGKLTSGAEEDLMGRETSRWYGETIFVHEFAHDVLYAIEIADPDLYRAVEAAYEAARAQGRWKDEYALTTVHEYWAEGTQFWFNSNKLAVMQGRQVLSDRDLAAYDPPLHAVLARAYGNRHVLPGDPFANHPARVPPGPVPVNTAEEC